MKKAIAFIISTAIIFAMISVVQADNAQEINDGLNDASKMYSSTSGLIYETKTSLGSYADPAYVTSNVGTMEVVYSLENMASFEVTTLNYKESEDIAFYVGSSESEYNAVTDAQRRAESLGSNWEKITYTAGVTTDNAKFFKIVINQTKAKYIRLDNVKVTAKFALTADKITLSRSGEEIADNNAYGANELTVTFNQGVSTIPALVISEEGKDDVTVSGKFAADSNAVVYDFAALGMDVYKFTANGFKTAGGMECDVSYDAGIKVTYGMPDSVHFGEKYTKSGFIEKLTDSKGTDVAVPEYTLTCKNDDIIALTDDTFALKAAGSAGIEVNFTLNNIPVTINRTIVLCGVSEFVLPQSITLSAGESRTLTAEIKLSDNTTIVPEEITFSSTDTSIVTVEGQTIKGITKGTAYINVSTDYYGTALKGIIPVGVGETPSEAAESAQLSVNRSEIFTGESIYAIVNCTLSNNEQADSVSIKKKFYSDNTAVAAVTDEGRITAMGEGSAQIYAEVTLSGVTVTTNKLTITVTKDTIAHAGLVLPSYYMLTGTSVSAAVNAYTKTGAKITDATVEYKINGTSLTASGNTMTAAASGVSTVTAKVTYNGSTVETPAVTVTVSDNNGQDGKDFTVDRNFNGVFYYSAGLTIYQDNGVLTNSDTETEPQYVIMESKGDMKSISVKGYYLTSKRDDDMQIWVSADNTDYTRIPEEKLTAKTQVDGNTAWYNLWYSYAGEMLTGMHYVKVVINRPADDHSQDIRIHAIYMLHDKAPEVAGVSLIDKNGLQAAGTDAAKITVAFSQNVDENSLGGISLKEKSSGKAVDFSGSYENGAYALAVNGLSQTEYELTVSGVKNTYGTEMLPYTYTISPVGKKKISVADIQLKDSAVTAKITNDTGGTVKATVITAAYDANGSMQKVNIDKDISIAVGDNDYTASASFAEASSVKVFVWTDMTQLDTAYVND